MALHQLEEWGLIGAHERGEAYMGRSKHAEGTAGRRYVEAPCRGLLWPRMTFTYRS
jgi:hypothetical protein